MGGKEELGSAQECIDTGVEAVEDEDYVMIKLSSDDMSGISTPLQIQAREPESVDQVAKVLFVNGQSFSTENKLANVEEDD